MSREIFYICIGSSAEAETKLQVGNSFLHRREADCWHWYRSSSTGGDHFSDMTAKGARRTRCNMLADEKDSFKKPASSGGMR